MTQGSLKMIAIEQQGGNPGAPHAANADAAISYPPPPTPEKGYP